MTKGAFPLLVIDPIVGNPTETIALSDGFPLSIVQLILVATNVWNHQFPFDGVAARSREVNANDIVLFHPSFQWLNGFHGCTTWTAPGGPEVHEYHLTRILCDDGIKYILGFVVFGCLALQTGCLGFQCRIVQLRFLSQFFIHLLLQCTAMIGILHFLREQLVEFLITQRVARPGIHQQRTEVRVHVLLDELFHVVFLRDVLRTVFLLGKLTYLGKSLICLGTFYVSLKQHVRFVGIDGNVITRNYNNRFVAVRPFHPDNYLARFLDGKFERELTVFDGTFGDGIVHRCTAVSGIVAHKYLSTIG